MTPTHIDIATVAPVDTKCNHDNGLELGQPTGAATVEKTQLGQLGHTHADGAPVETGNNLSEKPQLGQLSQLTQAFSRADVLSTLERSGLTARSDGDRLYLSPSELVTPEIREYVSAHRAAIMDAINQRSTDQMAKDQSAAGFFDRPGVRWLLDLGDGSTTTRPSTTDQARSSAGTSGRGKGRRGP